ncbi:hypothetical protein DIPPA_10580 [Diplonema papillatum]|nr:hypothetical protein DIPPA_10580 [Diplonema papillatum]
MENESHAAIGEASEVARAAEERASQVKRLEEFIKMLEEKHRSAEASLRSTVSDQSVALEQTKAAVYTASHPSWGVDTRFTLHRDGSFSRSGEKEGFWSLEVSGDGAYGDSAPAPVGGVTLRLIWVKGYQGGRVPARHSHDAEIDQLLSDDKGGTWVARSGFKLKIVEQRALFGPDRQPMAPDWLLAMVFQKKLEDAEARAASATWKWQASASASPRRQSTPILPHQAAQSNPSASPRGTFNGYSSPPRISNNPRPPVTPLGGDSFHPTSLKRTPAHPPQDPAHSPAHPFNSRTSIAHSPSPHFQHPSQPQSARQYHQPPSPLQAHAPPPASDAKQYEQIFSIQYPGVDASLLHGVSLNVAEGMMTETQARLMLTDMATVDAFEDM